MSSPREDRNLGMLNCECKANKGDTERTLRKNDQEKECWEPLLSYKRREKRAFQEIVIYGAKCFVKLEHHED